MALAVWAPWFCETKKKHFCHLTPLFQRMKMVASPCEQNKKSFTVSFYITQFLILSFFSYKSRKLRAKIFAESFLKRVNISFAFILIQRRFLVFLLFLLVFYACLRFVPLPHLFLYNTHLYPYSKTVPCISFILSYFLSQTSVDAITAIIRV